MEFQFTTSKMEDYKKDTATMLNISLDKVIDIKEVPWLEKMEKGTKSKLYEVLVRLDKSTSLILKEYDLDAIDLGGNNILKELITEKAVLKIAKKYNLENIFPKILSEDYEPFNRKNALLVETVSTKTLEQLLSSKNFTNLPYSERSIIKNKAIRNSLDISARFYDIFPKYRENIEDEMSRLSNGDFSKIEQKHSLDYVKSFEKYLRGLFGPSSTKKEKENFFGMIMKYWGDQADILHDCYPFNLAHDTFIDLGNIKKGPIALQIGCLLGYPSVFNVLRSDKNDNTFFSSAAYFANLGRNIKNPEEFSKGALIGAIYGNIRIAAGLKARHGNGYINQIFSLIYASRDQAKMLGNEAMPIYDFLSNKLERKEITDNQLELF